MDAIALLSQLNFRLLLMFFPNIMHHPCPERRREDSIVLAIGELHEAT